MNESIYDDTPHMRELRAKLAMDHEAELANDETDASEADTRERINDDLLAMITSWDDYDGDYIRIYGSVAYAQVKELLDRQAAITEREWREHCASEECCGFQELVDVNESLQAEHDDLKRANERQARKIHDVCELNERLHVENRELQDANDELQKRMLSIEDEVIVLESERDELYMRLAMAEAEAKRTDDGWMRLPVDADGVPIHIGDMIQQLNHAGVWTHAMPVVAVDENGCFALTQGLACEARTYVWCNNCRHVKERTVEDVLDEFASFVCEEVGFSQEDVKRCAEEIRELMKVVGE